MTIRIVLADDHELLRSTFRLLLEQQADLEVVAEASTGREAVSAAREFRADVVLMDIRMPETDGLWATEQIAADNVLRDVRVLILTTFEEDEYVARALQAGASGFIGKGISPAGLLDAIRMVAAGDALLSPRATQALIARFLQPRPQTVAPVVGIEDLTPREREMVALVASGMTNEEIAAEQFISALTVKTHVNRAMAKLHARDRAQLVVIAYQSGLVAPPPR